MSFDAFKAIVRTSNRELEVSDRQMESDSGDAAANCALASLQRRRAIKLALSVASVVPGISLAFQPSGILLPEKGKAAEIKNSVVDKVDDQAGAPGGFEWPNLTINININRPDIDDWLLFENLTESPLIIRQFSPRFVAYNAAVLDMNAMLARQQRGKHQLEIWPNHAWTHSVKGATSKRDIDQLIEYSNTVMVPNMPGHRSLQLPCIVDKTGVVKIFDSLS